MDSVFPKPSVNAYDFTDFKDPNSLIEKFLVGVFCPFPSNRNATSVVRKIK